MSKFILIDQSIEGNGGHYLEYATNVLRAAEALGYETGLAVNRRFQGKVPWNTYPVYSYNIWGSRGKKRALLKRIKRALATMRNCLRVWQAKSSFSAFHALLRAGRNKEYGQLPSLLRQMHPAAVVWIGLLFLPAAATYALYFISSRLCAAISHWKPVRALLQLMQRIGASAAEVCKAVSPRGALGRAVHRKRWEKNFEACTMKVIAHFQIGEGDLIFIPTLDIPDLKAVAGCISKHPRLRGISWHMVFRRNLFTGREPAYQIRNQEVLRFRKALLEFQKKAGAYENTYFYTDTNKLTQQYHFLKIVPFYTLPIPVNPRLQKNEFSEKQKPYNIVYLGDARKEKGYQLLEQVVQGVWEDYALTGRVRFAFQSNFSFDDFRSNYEVVYAKQSLMQKDRSIVYLQEHALGSEEYCEFVMGGDIGLLFYDRENYYARSSGALVECICFGMPVLVPSASWLSEELCVYNYAHIERLKKRMLPRKQPPSRWMSALEYKEAYGQAYGYKKKKDSKDKIEYQSPLVDGELSFSTYENRAVSRWEVPENTQFVVLSYRIHTLMQQGSFVSSKLSLYDAYGMLRDDFQSDDYHASRSIQVLFPVAPYGKYLEIELWSAFHDKPVSVYDCKVEFYHTPKAAELPYGTYGLVYAREKDIHRLLCNLIEQFCHYRKEAVKAAARYNAYHTAGNLVTRLAESRDQKKETSGKNGNSHTG